MSFVCWKPVAGFGCRSLTAQPVPLCSRQGRIDCRYRTRKLKLEVETPDGGSIDPGDFQLTRQRNRDTLCVNDPDYATMSCKPRGGLGSPIAKRQPSFRPTITDWRIVYAP